jgi:quinate dehydrogenase (quinone)
MVDTPLPGQGSALRAIPRLLLAFIVLATGLALGYGGICLLKLGGSAYYLIAGLAYLALGVLVLLRHRYTAAFSLLVFVATAV